MLLDDNEIVKYEDTSFIENVRWWERHRWVYNFVVLIAGAIPTLDNSYLLQYPETIFFIFVYAILANIYYCLGWGIDILSTYYFQHRVNGEVTRRFLLILGTVGSFLMTLLLAFIFSTARVYF